MKKYYIILVLVMACSLSYARKVNSLFLEFKEEPNAEYVSVSPFLMKLAKVFSHGEGNEIMGSILSIKVLDLEKCGTSVKECFNKRVDKLNLDGYETLIRVNDSGSKVRILMKQKKDYISELLIVCADKEDCALVQINGKIKKEDIDKLVDEQTNKKHGRQ